MAMSQVEKIRKEAEEIMKGTGTPSPIVEDPKPVVDPKPDEKVVDPPPVVDPAVKVEDPIPSPNPDPNAPVVEAQIDWKAKYDELKALYDADNSDTWKRKWATADGMLKAQGPRDAAKIKELQTAMAGHGDALKAKDAEIAKLAEAVKTQQKAVDPKILELKEKFGEDNPMVMMLEEIMRKNDNLEKLVKEKKVPDPLPEAKPDPSPSPAPGPADDPEQKFFEALNMAVPEWEAINANPVFLEALKGTEPTTGMTYQELLDYHYSKGNVTGVAAIFTKLAPAPGNGGKPKPTGEFKGIEEIVDPAIKGGGKPPAEKPKFDRAKSEKRIADYQRRGNPERLTKEEFDKFFKEYSEAFMAGRVT